MTKKNWRSDQQFRQEGFTTRVLHNCESCRVVLFNLAAGQEVEPHTADACVLMHVVDGSGFIRKGAEEIGVSKDDLVFFNPNEVHGMRAAESALSVMATIIPKPSPTPLS